LLSRPHECYYRNDLCTWLLLLLLEQSEKADTRHLGNLEADTGNITLGVTGATETSDENFVVFLEDVKATIAGHEGSDLLAVLDELDTDRLTNGRVRLLGLNSYFLEHNALCVGRSSERVALDGGTEVSLLVILIGPLLDTTVVAQLARTCDTARLSVETDSTLRQCVRAWHDVQGVW